MNISTKAQAENKDPALVIEQVTHYLVPDSIMCNNIYADYQTGIPGIQNKAIVRMTFLNTATRASGYVIYRIKLCVHFVQT